MSGMGQLAQRELARLNGAKTASSGGDQCNTFDECDEGFTEGPAGGQAETSIAVDSTGQHVVVGYNDTRGFDSTPISLSGVMYSDDGGQTFLDGGRLPVPAGQQVFGDPEVKYIPGGAGCQFVYFSILINASSVQTMGVHRSTDCGHTWSGPYEITPATVAGAAADKEFAAVEPTTGRVLLSWTNFPAGTPEISSAYSDNIMSSTPPTWSARSILANTANLDGQGSIPRFDAAGNAYVAWSRTTAVGNSNIGFAHSSDHGQTWTAAVSLTTDYFPMDQVLGNDRVHSSPSLAVDNGSGNVYVVYEDNANHDGADIAFQRSTDHGANFSAPIFINSRPGSDRAQWFPWVTVDQTTHRIYVMYYDQGIATSGDLTEKTYTYSDDGGLTWSPPMPISDRPFNAGWGNDTGQPNLGDYDQAVSQNGALFASFASTSPVGFADGQPAATMTTPDVTFKRVPAPSSGVPVRLGNISFTDGNGNGFVDRNEPVNLTIPLENYDTNALSETKVSGVSATLSTSTSGVNVTQPTSSYPDVTAGSSAANAASYVIKTTSSFVLGTHIELTLNVTTALGNRTLLYTLASGTPQSTTIFSEDFNGTTSPALPANWTAVHGAGTGTVPWTTTTAFCGATSNAAYHVNGNTASNTRWERLLSPVVVVPANAGYVTLDFDVCYDTEDDPNFNILAYDGFTVRLTDQTGGARTLRSVLAEAFQEQLTTGSIQGFPKHLPRNSNASYLQDMSVWGGDSGGWVHVHMKLPGMEGSSVQLRFEYTQDGTGTCTDVRPTHTTCGVMVDNIVMNSVTYADPKQPQTISFPAISGKTFNNPDFDPGASSSSGLGISYGASGNCTIVAGKVHLTGAGSCTVTASQAGNSDYDAASDVQRTFSIAKAPLSITASGRSKYFDQPITLGTTAFTRSGLVGSDSVSGVTLASAGAAASAASGNYPIAASSAVAGPGTNLGNYTITYHSGTLHVSAVGLIGLSGVTVSGSGGKIDSFNSALGVYGGSNHGSSARVLGNGLLSFAGVQLLGSTVSTMGSVSVASSAGVSGNVTAGTTASISGTVGGTVTQHAPQTSLSTPTVAACSPYSSTSGISGGAFTLSSGNLVVKSGTVKLASKTYCFNNVTLNAGAKLQVTGAVTINLKGKLTGTGLLVNTTNLPGKLRINSSFASAGGVSVKGGTNVALAIVAPKTSVTITGGSFFGTVLAKTVSLSGVAFHADQH